MRRIDQLPPVAPADTLAALPGVVDLWCFMYERVDEPSLFASYDELMAPDERARHRRFRFERDRHMFLATRALVRTALSHYADVAPADWRFATGERGKPEIAAPATKRPIRFNLSNTRGLVVCAVSVACRAVGVDTEILDGPGDKVSLANRCFSPHEVHALRCLPAADQQARFFSYWTLKESYVKARGLGFALPLDQFSFRLDDGPDIRITLDPRLSDDPSRWRFALYRASSRHLIAVAADTAGATLSLRATCYIPLRGVVAFESTTS